MIGKVKITVMDSELVGLWRHYKGGMYQVLMTASDADSLEEVVIYRSLSSRAVFSILRVEFEIVLIHNGVEEKRFERVLSSEN